MLTLGRAKLDIEFLLARCSDSNCCNLGEEERWTGVSSNALTQLAYGGKKPDGGKYPYDSADLAACFRTYFRLPPHRRLSKVKKMLRLYCIAVNKRYRINRNAYKPQFWTPEKFDLKGWLTWDMRGWKDGK